MTASYTIPKAISAHYSFRSKPVDPRAIRVVIPTFNDWDGLRETLDSLLNLKTPPKRIAVANDNPSDDVPNWLAQYPAKVVNYPGNAGPARARNRAFGLIEEFPSDARTLVALIGGINWGKIPDFLRNGVCPELRFSAQTTAPDRFEWDSDTDWTYFSDCGCTHDPDLFLKFEEAWQNCGDCCVAISGSVSGLGPGLINSYMTEQGILNPPRESGLYNAQIPQAIITANALVASLPFAFVGGFDPEFKEAAGEDLDLGIRLRELGVIAWAPEARVFHRFDEDESDFYKRFRRYGRGNRRLEMKHGLPCMRATSIKADRKNDPEHQRLANLSVEAMRAGYDEAVEPGDRGILRIINPK